MHQLTTIFTYVVENADLLAEYAVAGISGYRNGTKEEYSSYTISIGIARQPSAIIYNIIWPLNVVTVLTGLATVVDDLGSQHSAIITGVLIAVAFKVGARVKTNRCSGDSSS